MLEKSKLFLFLIFHLSTTYQKYTFCKFYNIVVALSYITKDRKTSAEDIVNLCMDSYGMEKQCLSADFERTQASFLLEMRKNAASLWKNRRMEKC